jgi:hypothetical protein
MNNKIFRIPAGEPEKIPHHHSIFYLKINSTKAIAIHRKSAGIGRNIPDVSIGKVHFVRSIPPREGTGLKGTDRPTGIFLNNTVLTVKIKNDLVKIT